MKYYGKDPIKKILKDPKKREILYKIFFIFSVWIWLAMFIGFIIFLLYLIKVVA
ncbi:hypothetical protein [Methanocaldococcus sp.]